MTAHLRAQTYRTADEAAERAADQLSVSFADVLNAETEKTSRPSESKQARSCNNQVENCQDERWTSAEDSEAEWSLVSFLHRAGKRHSAPPPRPGGEHPPHLGRLIKADVAADKISASSELRGTQRQGHERGSSCCFQSNHLVLV